MKNRSDCSRCSFDIFDPFNTRKWWMRPMIRCSRSSSVRESNNGMLGIRRSVIDDILLRLSRLSHEFISVWNSNGSYKLRKFLKHFCQIQKVPERQLVKIFAVGDILQRIFANKNWAHIWESFDNIHDGRPFQEPASEKTPTTLFKTVPILNAFCLLCVHFGGQNRIHAVIQQKGQQRRFSDWVTYPNSGPRAS